MVEFYVDIPVCSDFGVLARAFSSARPNGLRDSSSADSAYWRERIEDSISSQQVRVYINSSPYYTLGDEWLSAARPDMLVRIEFAYEEINRRLRTEAAFEVKRASIDGCFYVVRVILYQGGSKPLI